MIFDVFFLLLRLLVFDNIENGSLKEHLNGKKPSTHNHQTKSAIESLSLY